MRPDVLLTLSAVDAGYGPASVLHSIDLEVPRSSIAAIVGANGAGKTTLLSTIAGLVKPAAGRIVFDGHDISRYRSDQLVDMGLALVPEGGRLFPFMTVRENLELGAYSPRSRADTARRIEEVEAIFPILGERSGQLAGRLSGGERQMCAIGRALMSRPAMLMLDEPSVGLSPLMTERVLETVVTLARQEQLTVLIVEQRVTEVLEIADHAHILDHGRIVRSDAASVLLEDRQIQETYMGL